MEAGWQLQSGLLIDTLGYPVCPVTDVLVDVGWRINSVGHGELLATVATPRPGTHLTAKALNRAGKRDVIFLDDPLRFLSCASAILSYVSIRDIPLLEMRLDLGGGNNRR